MTHNGLQGEFEGFRYDEESDEPSDEDRITNEPSCPLGFGPPREQHLQMTPRDVSNDALPHVDLTQGPICRVSYLAASGCVEEGVYEVTSQSWALGAGGVTAQTQFVLTPMVPQRRAKGPPPRQPVSRSRATPSHLLPLRPSRTAAERKQAASRQPLPPSAPPAPQPQPTQPPPAEEVKDLVDGKGWRVTIRQYQLDLYRAACRRNVIAYLDTGSGKTFISVLLIRDIAAQCAQQNRSKASIFFLVPRKVLVHQQADVLKQFTDLTVSEHSGDRNNEDVWDKTTWQSYIYKADVMVMTPQILLNMLRKQVISLGEIRLIVFDECHHARKNTPYNCIMQEFYHPSKQARQPVPKIFGMTASLVTTKRNQEEVYNSFHELEMNLDCIIMTTSRENVQQHATSAYELDVPYTMNTTQDQFPATFLLLERASVRLNVANKLSLQHQRGGGGKKAWQVDSKKLKGPLDQHIRQVGNIYHVVSVMGMLAGSYALTEVAGHWRQKGERRLQSWNFPSAYGTRQDLQHVDDRMIRHPELRTENLGNLSEALYLTMVDMAVGVLAGLLQVHEAAARAHLEAALVNRPMTIHQVLIALGQLRSKLDVSPLEDIIQDTTHEHLQLPPDLHCSVFASHRMQQLLRVLMLEKSRIPHEERSKWRGMIFVQQTLMAIVLEHVLSHNPLLSFFKCQSLTGHNGSILSAAMEDHHQRKIVHMFRSGRVNLLISTSVAEEGLDITQCSMVIRFDLPFTEASYIQSRGRARKPGSSYVMFLNMDDPGEATMIGNLRFAEQCMKDFASARQHQEDLDADEDMAGGTADAYLEISRAESKALMPTEDPDNDPKLKVAVEMVFKYVSQLPQDEYCQLMPHLIYRSQTVEGRLEFQYQLTLPINAAITKPILGPWCNSKIKAKRAVCYSACCELRKLKELNERFYPYTKHDRIESTSRTARMEPMGLIVETAIDPDILKTEHAERRSEWESPASKLRLCLQVAIVIPHKHLDHESCESQPLPLARSQKRGAGWYATEAFGILTLRELDDLMPFPLYPETGDVEVCFVNQGEMLVTDAELRDIKRYHLAVVESLYFKTKLFTTVCREKSQELETLIDSDVQFLPEQLRQHENQISHINQSWYLICPIKSMQHTQDETSHYSDEEMEDEECLEMKYEIDWGQIREVGRRMLNLHTPGVAQSQGGLEGLEKGEVLISPYNNTAYKLVGVREDLGLHSAFPAQPRAAFYDISVTQKEYRGTYVPNRSGVQFSTFHEYYTQHWKFNDLDKQQPLLECVSFKQVPVMKRAKNLLNPIWKQAMEIDVPEEPLDDWNTAVHVVPELVVLYPLNYTFWQSLSYIVAICWKLEAMLKVAELRNKLSSGPTSCIAVPDIALIYESVTSKSCHEHCTYERLEFIGDAALKYISSLYCFFKYPVGHEGVLTTERSALISNRRLASVAAAMGIQTYIRSIQLGDHPWRPAGSQFLDACWVEMGKKGQGHSWFGGRNQKVSQENQQHQSKTCTLGTKVIADVVEALLGASFIFGDIPCVCALMDRMGILEDGASFLLTSYTPHSEFGAWLEDLGDCMEVPNLEGLEQFEANHDRHFEHGREIQGLEQTIGYQFRSPSFALEALTHCSWPHPDPPCYQRLEYLGDAVLDFMITRYYFTAYQDVDPGRLTALRSASVNNDRLATSAVKYELFKYILHFSAFLQSHITDYVAGYDDGETSGAPKVLGDIVESLIGAVYLDLYGDIEATWQVWKPLLQPFYSPDSVPVHPVVYLIHYCHVKGLTLEFRSVKADPTSSAPSEMEDPDAMDISTSDDEDEEEWIVEKPCGKQALLQMEATETASIKKVQVVVNGKVIGEGQGSTQKGAKKQAATVAVEAIPWELN